MGLPTWESQVPSDSLSIKYGLKTYDIELNQKIFRSLQEKVSEAFSLYERSFFITRISFFYPDSRKFYSTCTVKI